ncbi:MAG: tyrosine-type recombinase/integrase [Bacteroidetes bacterium]|nr:tyrosine-type recombinase/integrase [Bacteroidota bacterium]
MFQEFINYLQFEKRCSEHTVTAYQNDLAQFQDYFELKSITEMNDLNSLAIRSWIVHLIDTGLGNRSVNRKIASLRTLFKWLRKEGIVNSNPMAKIQGPKNEKRLPVFAKESELDSTKLTEMFNDDFDGIRDELMIELFYQTGIRLNELINLKETDVNEQHIKVLGKRNKERLIPISANLFEQIHGFIVEKRKLVGETKFLIVLKNGNKLYPTFVYRKINAYLSQATSLDKKSPHVLRHTFATHMLNRGSGLETLKDLLGHANLAATQVYTHNSFAQLTAIYSQAHPRGR